MSDNELDGYLDRILSGVLPLEGAEPTDDTLGATIDDLLEVSTEADYLRGDEAVKGAPLLIPAELREEAQDGAPDSAETAWNAAFKEKRTHTLDALLNNVSILGGLAIAALLVSLIVQPSGIIAASPYFVAYIVLLVITIARRLSYTPRAALLIAMLYIIGVYALANAGPFSAGAFCLLTAPIMYSILFTQPAGTLVAVALSIIFYTILLALYARGWYRPALPQDLTDVRHMLSLIGVFTATSAIAVLAERMFHQDVNAFFREAGDVRVETIRAQKLCERRANELATANAQLQKLSLQLKGVTRVALTATAVLDPQDLAQQVVDVIHAQFGLYYVSILAVDEPKQRLTLLAGAGEMGRRMQMQGYSVAFDDSSAAGWCAVNAQPRVLPGSEAAPPLPLNPFLPETRSELALPLRSHNAVFGVLDLHSIETGAFSQEDVAVLQVMAEQLAVAIEKAQAFAEMKRSLEEGKAQLRHESREQWAAYARAIPHYERDQPGVAPLGRAVPTEVERAMAQGELVTSFNDKGDGASSLVAPISLRGEIIGALGLENAQGERQWAEDEIALIEAITDQMALAIENARLLEETRRYAEWERLSADIASQVRASTEVETILRTTIRELGRALRASDGMIHLSSDAGPDESGKEVVDDRTSV